MKVTKRNQKEKNKQAKTNGEINLNWRIFLECGHLDNCTLIGVLFSPIFMAGRILGNRKENGQ